MRRCSAWPLAARGSSGLFCAAPRGHAASAMERQFALRSSGRSKPCACARACAGEGAAGLAAVHWARQARQQQRAGTAAARGGVGCGRLPPTALGVRCAGACGAGGDSSVRGAGPMSPPPRREGVGLCTRPGRPSSGGLEGLGAAWWPEARRRGFPADRATRQLCRRQWARDGEAARHRAWGYQTCRRTHMQACRQAGGQ